MKIRKTMLIRIRNMFFAGIVVIFPIIITFVMIRILVVNINNWILNPISKFLAPFLGGPYSIYAAKAGIFLGVILVICVIGLAANIIVLRKIFAIGENIFLKIPMFGKIYNAVKQISTAFLGEGKTIFKRVVLVQYPRKGIYSIGFTTGYGRGEICDVTGETLVNIFIPTTPNPTSGIFILVPKNEVRFLKMSVEEGMKFIISGGAIVPPFESRLAKEKRTGK